MCRRHFEKKERKASANANANAVAATHSLRLILFPRTIIAIVGRMADHCDLAGKGGQNISRKLCRMWSSCVTWGIFLWAVSQLICIWQRGPIIPLYAIIHILVLQVLARAAAEPDLSTVSMRRKLHEHTPMVRRQRSPACLSRLLCMLLKPCCQTKRGVPSL